MVGELVNFQIEAMVSLKQIARDFVKVTVKGVEQWWSLTLAHPWCTS